MSERLNFEQAYLESLAYREDDPEDYQRLSDQLDESRSIMEHFDDDSFIHAHAQADANEEYFEPEQPDALLMFDNAIWDMPYLDPERALSFFEKVFDLVKYREEKDESVPGELAGTIAIGSMKRLTRVLGDRTIPLWNLGYQTAQADELDVTLGEQVVDNPDIKLSDRFLEEVVYPASKGTGDIFLWEFTHRDAWIVELESEARENENEREGSTCRPSDKTQAELDPILGYVLNAEPVPAEILLELSSNNGSGLRRVLASVTANMPFQNALTNEGVTARNGVRGRFDKLEGLARKLDAA